MCRPINNTTDCVGVQNHCVVYVLVYISTFFLKNMQEKDGVQYIKTLTPFPFLFLINVFNLICDFIQFSLFSWPSNSQPV